MGWPAFYRQARQQHGAFAVRDAPSVGLSSDAVMGRAQRERWDRPYRGIVIAPGMHRGHHTMLSAAQLRVGPTVAATDVSGAWLLGLTPRPPRQPQLIVPHARRVRLRGQDVQRSRQMTAHDCTTRDGLATVNAEFLIIRLARTESADRLTALALDARQRGLFQMSRFAQRMTAVGPVPGRARLVHVVGVLTADDSDSIFEREVRARLLADGFRPSFGPTPVALPSGSVLHLDITFPEERVAVECQGFLAHHDRRQLDRDARRDNALAIAGNWLVLKLTWDRFRHDWEGFAAELRSALAARTRAR